MAYAGKPLTFTSAVVAAAGTSVAPGTAVPDNCHTIIIVNRSLATAYVGLAVPGGALTSGTDAAPIPPGTSLTLDVGTIRARGAMNQATIAGSGLAVDGTAALTVEITYINQLGGI